MQFPVAVHLSLAEVIKVNDGFSQAIQPQKQLILKETNKMSKYSLKKKQWGGEYLNWLLCHGSPPALFLPLYAHAQLY